jgi:hypothetical protein
MGKLYNETWYVRRSLRCGTGGCVAWAGRTVTLNDSYSFTETYNNSHGGPTITNNWNGSAVVTIGSALPGTAPTNFATFAPAGSCTGGGCNNVSPYPTETDPFSVTFGTFNFNFGNNVTATASGFTETGTFEAKYGGAELPCSTSGTGDTDCVLWTGAPTTPTGSTSFSELMSNGDTLTVTFYNANDWNITPKVSFDVVDAPAVPESSTWAMMMLGFAGLGFAAYRGRGRPAISIV